jgi:hypothetical protein
LGKPSLWHLLDALKRFDSLDPRRVMEITFEVARLGESGLDYANPEKKYTFSAYPGESLSSSRAVCIPDSSASLSSEAPA